MLLAEGLNFENDPEISEEEKDMYKKQGKMLEAQMKGKF